MLADMTTVGVIMAAAGAEHTFEAIAEKPALATAIAGLQVQTPGSNNAMREARQRRGGLWWAVRQGIRFLLWSARRMEVAFGRPSERSPDRAHWRSRLGRCARESGIWPCANDGVTPPGSGVSLSAWCGIKCDGCRRW